MADPAVTAKQRVHFARKHIEDQQSSIFRQRELMAKYERDDDVRGYQWRALSLSGCKSSLLK